MPNATLSELEAVNEILSGAGLRSVNSFSSSGGTAADRALQELRRQNRTVQSMGWWFNMRTQYLLQRNGDNEIPVPPEVMSFNDPGDDVIIIGGKLFSKESNSSEFTSDLSLDAILFFVFADIPFPAQDYIVKKATRIYQVARVGDQALQRNHFIDEQSARAAIMQADAEVAGRNILLNTSLRYAVRRPRRASTSGDFVS